MLCLGWKFLLCSFRTLGKISYEEKAPKNKQLDHTNNCTSSTTREIERTRNSNRWISLLHGHCIWDVAIDIASRQICYPVEPSPSSRQQIASKCFLRAGIDADSYLWGFRNVQELLEKLHNICSSIPFRCRLPSHNLLPTTKRTNSVLLPISSSNELALDEKKEFVFSRSLAIVRLCCGVLRTSSSSADGLPTPSLSLPGTASASSRFAKMRDWLRRLLLPRSCCEEFAQGFRFRLWGKERKKERKQERKRHILCACGSCFRRLVLWLWWIVKLFFFDEKVPMEVPPFLVFPNSRIWEGTILTGLL